MSVRKRILPRTGALRWYVDYRDQQGKRRAKQFETKADAVSFETTVRGELKSGTHVPDSITITMSQAAALWIARAERMGREVSTIKQYNEHVDIHIKPLLGTKKLSQLSQPAIESFKDTLLETRSAALTKAVLASVKAILSNARRLGKIGRNVAEDVRVEMSSRDKAEITIPSKAELRMLIEKAAEMWPLTRVKTDRKGKQKVLSICWRPLITTAVLTGLRSSELRGLTWAHVDFVAGAIRVRQRADLKNNMGPPKSNAGRRDVPMAPLVARTMKEWKLACPVTELDLVFPAQSGGIVTNGTIHRRCWALLQKACGLVENMPRLDKAGAPVLDKAGNPIIDAVPKYTFHALRHAAASLFIEEGWTPKRLQKVLGHSTISMSMDTYGHLFSDPDGDARAMAGIEARLLGRP
ncbi:MAG TPA: site-specific integrase [Stellaceae bacterium]|nr:site-specific integrase [Stellaceae bacterium]